MEIIDLGLIPYDDFLAEQSVLLEKRLDGSIDDTLIVAEHEPVVTLGRLSRDEEVIDSRYFTYNEIPVIRSNRGGKITYHSPGQVVLYPLIDLSRKLKDVSSYIDFLERTVCRGVSRLGVEVSKNGDRRGVWCGQKKLSFIGVAFKRWVSFHGVSINISNDIEPFDHIDPCGEKNIKVTSVKKVLGIDVDLGNAKKTLVDQFISDFYLFYRDKENSTVSLGQVKS